MSFVTVDIETKDNPNGSYYEEILNGFIEREKTKADSEKRAERPIQTALLPQLSKIVSIGWVWNDDPDIKCLVTNEDGSEADIIKAFVEDTFHVKGQKPDSFVTYNGIKFDFPFIRFRGLMNNVSIPFVEIKVWEQKIIDLYLISQNTCFGAIPMKLMGLSIGLIPLEQGVSGADLPKSKADLRRYQISDVDLTRRIYYNFKYAGFVK